MSTAKPTHLAALDDPVDRTWWKRAVLLVCIVTLVKMLYLVWLCPYELAADEAQYWDWSRRLDLSYYSKGPGVAWLIAASTSILGDAEWAIRWPAAISMGITMFSVIAITRAAAGTSGGVAAMLGAVAFLCLPAYHATAILMTIDAPYIACWSVAAWIAWIIHDRAGHGRSTFGYWLLLGLALGVGFLFKYTMLLLMPGLLLWAIARRRAGLASPRGKIGAAAALVVFLITSSPVVIWNHMHNWPTVAHLLGHLGAPGGDLPKAAAEPWTFDILWPLEFIGGQIGIVGPLLAAMFISMRIIRRDRDSRHDDHAATLFAVCLASPILLFYLAVSFVTDAEGNWPIAGYTTLLIPVSLAARTELPRYAALVRVWKAKPDRPWSGYVRAKPETPFQIAWDWAVAYGLIAAIGIHSLSILHRVPGLGPLIPYDRLSGQREFALQVHAVIEEARRSTGLEPSIIADRYNRAALLAYYLPEQPAVSSATSLTGGRRSSYDLFPDTDLSTKDRLSRPAVLVGSKPETWNRIFQLSDLERRLDAADTRANVYLVQIFHGLRKSEPSPQSSP